MAGGLRPESFPDLGVGGAGKQGDDADATRAEFFAERIGEAEGGVLGGVVGGGSGEDASGGDGQIVHDRGAAFHDGETGLSDQESSVEVGGEHVFPDGIGEFFYGEVRMGDAGVVDNDVEAVELAAEGAEEVVDRVRIADVARMSKDFYFWRG